MVAQMHGNMIRVSLTLDPVDVDLIDRLAKLEGLNRSAEVRALLAQIRPMIRQTVEAFETASRFRDELDAAAAEAMISPLQELLPEAERLQNAYMGILARIEGLSAAQGLREDLDGAPDPRPSRHGGHTPTPPPPAEEL